MKNKKNLTLAILCLMSITLGCNTYRDFVIVNVSNEIIEIEYDLT
jgi:phosphate/sulfate permease